MPFNIEVLQEQIKNWPFLSKLYDQKVTLNIMIDQYQNQTAGRNPKLYRTTKFQTDFLKRYPK
jgi:uncharacterized membrane protein YkgB